MAAASNGSFGRLCRPASNSSVNQGVHSQMSVSRMMPNALQRCTSQGWPSSPIASSTTFTMPNWSLKIQRIMIAAMTGATISGTSRMVCTSFCPGKGRLSSSASASPATSAPATLSDHEDERVGQHDVKERRIGDHAMVVREPDPDLLGIIERPVAKAGIGADHDRHHLEQQHQQRRRRDQKQHEALLLAEHGTPRCRQARSPACALLFLA